MASPVRWSGWGQFLLAAFGLIFFGRAWLVGRYGVSIAMVDEWQATAGEILAPWRDGTLQLPALFEAHNGDHRIVATRLGEIFWFVVNGAWDPHLILTAKAAVYAAAATGFIHLLARGLGRSRYVAGGVLGLLFAFPFSYQNLIWAFQSQFDFFLLAVAAGWLAMTAGHFAGAALSAFLALFTLGAGPVLAASYVPFLLWRWWATRRRNCLFYLALALAVVFFGLSLRSGRAAPLGGLAAQAETFTSILAWPYSNVLARATAPQFLQHLPARLREFPSPDDSLVLGLAEFLSRHPGVIMAANALVALALLFPLVALARQVTRARVAVEPAMGPLLLAGFALLGAVATGIARGGQQTVAARYLDVVALIGFSAIAAAFALSEVGPRWRKRMMLWGFLFLPGYLVVAGGSLAKLNQRMPAHWLGNLQRYFPHHDHSLLADNRHSTWPILETDSVPEFMAFLDRPEIESVLPASLTAPEAPLPACSALAAGVRRTGWIFALLAAAGMVHLIGLHSGWARASRWRALPAFYPAGPTRAQPVSPGGPPAS